MISIRSAPLASLSAALALILAYPAQASGGGGSGGGMSAPSMSAPSYDPAEEYRKGVEAYQAGRFRDAERDFDHVLEVAPDNADVLFMSGLAKAGKGDLKGAQRAYERSLKADPKPILARRELALTLAKLGQADKAHAQLDVLQKRSDACATSCPEAADLTAAIAEIQTALAPPAAPPSATAPATSAPGAAVKPLSLLFGDPAKGDAAYVDAVRLINQGRFEAALTALQRARQVFGPHPDVLTYTGYAYRKLHRYDEAERYYKAALAIAPNHVGATEYYGELMVVRGDIAGARAMLAKLENACSFGCIEIEDLRRWIEKGPPAS